MTADALFIRAAFQNVREPARMALVFFCSRGILGNGFALNITRSAREIQRTDQTPAARCHGLKSKGGYSNVKRKRGFKAKI
jgi:hypothetical protein